jgi:hypothetical protein
MGYLYIYEFHGRNTFSKEHHYRLMSCRAPNDIVDAQRERIRETALHFAIAKPFTVIGADGPVFSVS